MVQRLKILVFVCFVGFFYMFLMADDAPLFLKPKKKVKIQSPAKLKEAIGYELEALLVNYSELIAVASKNQKTLVSKMHSLLVPEQGDFFSRATVKDLDHYLQGLKRMHQELNCKQQSMTVCYNDFSKNFVS